MEFWFWERFRFFRVEDCFLLCALTINMRSLYFPWPVAVQGAWSLQEQYEPPYSAQRCSGGFHTRWMRGVSQGKRRRSGERWIWPKLATHQNAMFGGHCLANPSPLSGRGLVPPPPWPKLGHVDEVVNGFLDGGVSNK